MDRKRARTAQFRHAIDRVACHVHQPAFHLVAGRHGDRHSVRYGLHASFQPVGRIHGYGSHRVLSDVLLHLYDQDFPVGAGYLHRVVDTGQRHGFLRLILKVNVHDRTDNL